jgi:hypothetical protein
VALSCSVVYTALTTSEMFTWSESSSVGTRNQPNIILFFYSCGARHM